MKTTATEAKEKDEQLKFPLLMIRKNFSSKNLIGEIYLIVGEKLHAYHGTILVAPSSDARIGLYGEWLKEGMVPYKGTVKLSND